MNPTQTKIRSKGAQKEAPKVQSPRPTNASVLDLARAYWDLCRMARRVAPKSDRVTKGNENSSAGTASPLGSPAAQADQFSTYSPMMAADLPPAPVPPTKSRTSRRKFKRIRR